MNNVIKLYQPPETDKQKSVKETLEEFTKFCEEERAEGVICIAYKKCKEEEMIGSFSSHLTFCEKMGMLEEAKQKFFQD